MQNLRDFFRTSLGRGLAHLSDEDRLSAAWPVACGPALAGRSSVAHLDEDRILHIAVTGQQWMHPLLQMRTALQNDTARIAAVRLSGIHFQVKPHARPPTGSSTP